MLEGRSGCVRLGACSNDERSCATVNTAAPWNAQQPRLPCCCNAPRIADFISFSVATFHIQYVDLIIMLIYLERAYPTLKNDGQGASVYAVQDSRRLAQSRVQICQRWSHELVGEALAAQFRHLGRGNFPDRDALLELLGWDLAVTKEQFDKTYAGLCYEMRVHGSWPATAAIWATKAHDPRANHAIHKPPHGSSRHRKTDHHNSGLAV
ncbi:hypothetical protein EDB81DRAFT_768621 [Dactylonectria macrodidyma]|uniref:Uncharacterized protein n=1 Tax=Dactylonectria macrodidyma TaxID=307937 RepID=A0A9P9D2F4_9HYPO|nr:hypothetical protein EDB81DRAFT_768621 [Dactylonectria macrodidyma]